MSAPHHHPNTLPYVYHLQRKLENDLLVGEALVDSGEGVKLSLDVLLVLGGQVHLVELAVKGHAGALADDLGGVHHILWFQVSIHK